MYIYIYIYPFKKWLCCSMTADPPLSAAASPDELPRENLKYRDRNIGKCFKR